MRHHGIMLRSHGRGKGHLQSARYTARDERLADGGPCQRLGV